MKTLTNIVVAAALLLPFASSASAITIERIAAIAGDEVITLQDLRTEGLLRLAVKGKDLQDIDSSDTREADLDALTKELVQARLIHRQAKKIGVNVGDREVNMQLQEIFQRSGQNETTYKEMMQAEGIKWEDYRRYLRNEIEAQFVMRSELGAQITPSEADVIACAQETAPDTEKGVSVTVRQIIIPDIKADSSLGLVSSASVALNAVWWDSIDMSLKLVAQGVQRQAAENPNDFVALVQKFSTGRTVSRDGLLGDFSPGDLSRDFNSVFTMAAGDISEVIVTGAGYHILKVDAVNEGESEAWKKMLAQCREQIVMRETQRLIDSWLSDLLEKNFVSIMVNENIKK